MMQEWRVELGRGGPFWVVEAKTAQLARKHISKLTGHPLSAFVVRTRHPLSKAGAV